jgi:hypothetical protein
MKTQTVGEDAALAALRRLVAMLATMRVVAPIEVSGDEAKRIILYAERDEALAEAERVAGKTDKTGKTIDDTP